MIGSLDDFDIYLRHYFCHSAAKQGALIATIGVEPISNFVDLRVEHDLKLVVLHGNSAANIQVDSVNASEWTPVVPCERDGLRDQGRKHVAHRRAMRGDRAIVELRIEVPGVQRAA